MKRIQRWRKGCRWLLILALVFLLLLCLLLCGLVVRPHLTATAAPHREAAAPRDVLLLLDHSNSMGAPGESGSDPEQLRLEAAGLFITYLGLEAESVRHRLGLIHFGTESYLIQPLTPLDSPATREHVRRALEVSELLGWTDPLAALELAYEELFESERAAPDPQAAVVLLTDGRIDLPSLQTPDAKAAYVAALRELAARFHARQCPIFTLAVTPQAFQRDPDLQTYYRNVWQELAALTPPAAYFEIATMEDVPDAYHQIAARLLGFAPQSPLLIAEVAGTYRASVPVEDGLAQLKLSIFKRDPATAVTVYRPGGALLRPEDPDVHHLGDATTHDEVWAIAQPRAGVWRLTFSGQSTVTVWKDARLQPGHSAAMTPYNLTVQVPLVRPAQEALDIHCRVTSGPGGTPLEGDAQVIVELRRAAFAEATLLARPAGAGIYSAHHEGLPPGTYSARARVLHDGQTMAQGERAFEVVALPHLDILTPLTGTQVQAGHPLSVAFQVRRGSEVLVPATLATWGTVTATLRAPTGTLHALSPQPGPAGLFVARDLPLPDLGAYTLTVTLGGKTDAGLVFSDHRVIPLQCVASVPRLPQAPAVPRTLPPSDADTVTPWYWPALVALVGVAGAGGSGMLLARQQRPRLEGQWRVLRGPGYRMGQVIALPAQRRPLALGDSLGTDTVGGHVQPGRAADGTPEVWLSPAPGADGSPILCNEHPVVTAQCLHDGDVIVMGDYRLRYENVREAVQQRSQRR